MIICVECHRQISMNYPIGTGLSTCADCRQKKLDDWEKKKPIQKGPQSLTKKEFSDA